MTNENHIVRWVEGQIGRELSPAAKSIVTDWTEERATRAVRGAKATYPTWVADTRALAECNRDRRPGFIHFGDYFDDLVVRHII